MAKSKDEIREQELPEVDIVGKAPKREIVTPTEGKVEAPGQIASVPVYTTPVEQPRVEESAPRRQRDVNFGEGLAKVASVMGMGQGDDGRDRVAAREQRAAERRERQEARQDARQAVRDERQALRDARVAENRENRLNAQQVRRDARDVARMEREQSRLGAQQVRDAARQVRQEERDAARQVRVDDRLVRRDERVQSSLDRADERAARVEEIAQRRGAREAARVEAENTRDANRAARREANEAGRQERVDARVERREARQERVEGKPQGLSRLEAPTNDAPTEVTAPADKAPAAKSYGVTTIEEPNVTRRPSGEGGTTAEQREITDAEARKMRGYTDGEPAAANGQGAERKVTYIEEPNVQRRPVVNEDDTVVEDKPISDEEARKMRGYGDNVVDHTTAREIPKATSVYDIEKERQAKRDAEKAIADYDAKEYVRVMDSLKPKHDPVEWKEEEVPIIEDIEEEAMLSDAEWINKYMKDLGFDKEEVERQKKAAKWAVAAQMLADSIGALSNVYWTGKGANAMKFEPGAPKAAAAANKMYADIREAREKALKAALDERKAQFDMEMAKKNLDLNVKKHEFDKQKHEDDQIIKLGNLEISREKLNNDKEYQTQILDLRMQELMQQGEKAKDALAISMAELGLKREQLKLSEAELAARVDGSYYADTQGVPKKQQFSVGGKTVSFDNFSEAQMYQIYNALPEEVKEKVGKGKVTYDKYGNLISDANATPEAKDILHAIHANTNDPNVARAIAQAAGDQKLIDAYDKVITDNANADAAAAERKRSLIAEANKVAGVVDDDALKAAIKSGDEAKIQAEMDRVKAGKKYKRKAGGGTKATTEVVQSTGTIDPYK